MTMDVILCYGTQRVLGLTAARADLLAGGGPGAGET